jgi:hypothetical protein
MPFDHSYRLNFFVDDVRKVLIIRPIGCMPPRYFIADLFAAYAKVKAPWTYGRLSDLRRFDWTLTDDDVKEIARRWSILTAGQTYSANVAVVSNDPTTQVRIPAASEHFLNETICMFTDYHEAMGWLVSTQKQAYLDGIRSTPPKAGRMDHQIVVQ